MAKVSLLVSVVVAVCIVGFGQGQEMFKVEGDVYCDPCRIQFQTPLSKKLPGAAIRLECSNIDSQALTYSINGTSDGEGHYTVEVEGDHEDDICEVKVVRSPDAECNVSMDHEMTVSRVVCAVNSGINSDVRYANPIGFMTNQVDPKCTSVIRELFTNDD